MGLMDDVKKAQEMAQQAQQQAAQAGAGSAMSAGVPGAAEMEFAQTAQKLATSGTPGVATIKAVKEVGPDPMGGPGTQYAIDCSIELEGGESYETTVNQSLTKESIDSGHYVEGKRFEVKVDPDDKSKALLYGLAD
jgi:hypothetical protein